VSAGNLATGGRDRPRTAVGPSETGVVYVAFGLPWQVVGEARPSSVDRMGRVIVLMQGPYDSSGKKVNKVKTYDVFGSHKPFNAAMIGIPNPATHINKA